MNPETLLTDRQAFGPACCRCHQSSSNVEERYSLGIYAGRWCDECWAASAYRKEDRSGFDPLDAGEAYEEEDY